MTVLGAGLALLFVGGERRFATAPDPLLGNVLAAGSAVAWAFTVTGYRWLARDRAADHGPHGVVASAAACGNLIVFLVSLPWALPLARGRATDWLVVAYLGVRSEEHTSELQSRLHLVCRLLLEKKNKNRPQPVYAGLYARRLQLLHGGNCGRHRVITT